MPKMKLSRWLLLMSAACTAGSSSSGPAAGAELVVLEGVTNDKLVVCLTGAEDFVETFVVRNVSGTRITLDVVPQIVADVAAPKYLLDAGESETVTVRRRPANAYQQPYSDGVIDLFARVAPSESSTSNGSSGASSDPALLPTQRVSVPVHFDVDDRSYRLTALTDRLVGHQTGTITWEVIGSASLPAPRIAIDGPFETDLPSGDGSTGAFTFHIAGTGAMGEEVKATFRVAPLRCAREPLPEPVPLPVSGRRTNVAKQIATGLTHTCALDTSGRVLCWGDDSYGQLGQAPGALAGAMSKEPVLVAGLGAGVEAIAAGRAHMCALRAGEVLCWGDSSLGQCGPGGAGTATPPTKVTLGMAATSIVARGDRSCASLAGGQVTCWGRDALGTGQTPPTALAGTTGAVQVALGDAHVCIRSGVGQVLCSGAAGRIGDGTTTPSDTPVPILTDVTDIAAGATHTCAVTKMGTLVCWGDLPDFSSGTSPLLTPQSAGGIVPSVGLVLRVVAAGRTTCTMGMGIGCSDITAPPTQNVTTFDTGGAHVCAVFDGGKVTCAGDNARNQLGLGDEGYGLYGFDAR